MKKIAIFGATGMTGLCALEAAVKKGLNVKVLVRDPSKLPEDLKTKVEVVTGDVLNYTDVRNAIEGVSGVSVILGTRNNLGPTTTMSDGMKNIINAMKELKIEPISVCISAFLFFEPDKVPVIFKEVTADHKRMFELIKACDLKYIAVFPPHIADQPDTGYETKHDESPGRVVSKHALGRFLIECLDESEHYRKVVGIHNKSS